MNRLKKYAVAKMDQFKLNAVKSSWIMLGADHTRRRKEAKIKYEVSIRLI